MVREVVIGPKARVVLAPFLDRTPDAFAFSPREGRADHTAARSSGEKDESAAVADRPPQGPAASGAGREVHREGVLPRRPPSAGRAGRRASARGTRINSGTPRRLPCGASSGSRSARVVLGHATAFTTEIYAEADRAKASKPPPNSGERLAGGHDGPDEGHSELPTCPDAEVLPVPGGVDLPAAITGLTDPTIRDRAAELWSGSGAPGDGVRCRHPPVRAGGRRGVDLGVRPSTPAARGAGTRRSRADSRPPRGVAHAGEAVGLAAAQRGLARPRRRRADRRPAAGHRALRGVLEAAAIPRRRTKSGLPFWDGLSFAARIPDRRRTPGVRASPSRPIHNSSCFGAHTPADWSASSPTPGGSETRSRSRCVTTIPAAGTAGPATPRPRLSADVANGFVVLDGRSISTSPTRAALVQALVVAAGDWRPGCELRDSGCAVDQLADRPPLQGPPTRCAGPVRGPARRGLPPPRPRLNRRRACCPGRPTVGRDRMSHLPEHEVDDPAPAEVDPRVAAAMGQEPARRRTRRPAARRPGSASR